MAFTRVSGCCLTLCLLLVVGFLLLPSTSAISHYESYTYSVTVSKYNCYTYYCTYCYNWWYWNYWHWDWYWYRPWYYGYYWNPWWGWGWHSWCGSYQQQNCYYTYTTEQRVGQRCVSGWIGSACEVPTCTPSCASGMVCVDLNKCACASDGSITGNCQIQPCSPENNCYPGSCVSGSCKCPPGFSGPNCLNFTHTPTINRCTVQLYAQPAPGAAEVQVAAADCAADGLTPSVTWINGPMLNKNLQSLGLTKIEPIWTAVYTYPTAMPTRPSTATQFFVSNAPVAMGIADASFTVVFPNNGNLSTSKYQCSLAGGFTSLPSTAACDTPMTWDDLHVNSLIGHNTTIIVRMTAQLGGKKTGDSSVNINGQVYGFGDQYFVGTPVVIQSMLKFDIVPPSHCLLSNGAVLTPGNDRVNCTVFPIYLDQDIRTNPVIKPLFIGWSDDGSGISRYHVEVYYMQPSTSGVLEPNGQPLADSVADVSPTLNNYQFTVPTPGVYSIYLTVYDYANNSATARKIFNYMNQPSYSLSSYPVFIQEANPATNYTYISILTNHQQVTLVWTGRFQPNPLYQSTLCKSVRKLPTDTHTVDDIYGAQFGQRSINAVDNQTGISSYTVRYLVDPINGGLTALSTDTNTTANVTVGGETATLIFQDPLKDGDTVVVWLTATGSTGNQTTYQLTVTVDTTRLNISEQSFAMNGIDEYTSSVTFLAFDKESGINSTQYRIVDSRSNVEIVPMTIASPIRRDAPDSRKKRATGLQTPCMPGDATCYCTPSKQCFAYEQTIKIDNCLLDRFSGRDNDLVFRYTVTNMAGISTSENFIKLGDISSIRCRPLPSTQPTTQSSTGPSGGAIAGIVIGCFFGFLLLACLVLLIVLMIVRIRQHKRPIPNRKEMRTMASNARTNVRNRFTMRRAENAAADNVVYAAGPSKDLEKKVNNNDYVEDPFKISSKDVQYGDVLAEGKFAVVSRAQLLKSNAKEQVATKALRNGCSQSDEELMASKIKFMKTVPDHRNLVKFIGYIAEPSGEGQVMVLELCDYPLKNWFESRPNLSTDDLEMMLGFTLNIAEGVAHLHRNQKCHRRLAMRNVLLKRQGNVLVAKLIGFGPNAEDGKSGTTSGEPSLPIKWLAPETLDTSKKPTPTYNEKTDAWSFGVTVWEIYSKGAAPYGDVKSKDMKDHLKQGNRLQCPAECPPELFTTVVQPCWKQSASSRPSFRILIENIQKFRSGSSGADGSGGYYASDEVGGNNDQYYAASAVYADGR